MIEHSIYPNMPFPDEAARIERHPQIYFRDTLIGRIAYVRQSRIAVDWLVGLVEGYHGQISTAAEHLCWPEIAFVALAPLPEEVCRRANLSAIPWNRSDRQRSSSVPLWQSLPW